MLMSANAAFAQETPAENETKGLQDIVVTAQRRAESLQKAAVAVSVVSGDELRNSGISRPTELTALVPALQVATSAGPYNLFYLRGVGNFNGNALSDAAVAFNYNGVYVGRPSSTTGFFYDVERLEVLKGPQGTLYGRNATGGAINVITNAPKIGELSGEVVGEYGNYNAYRVDGALNVPLGDKAALRAAAIVVKHDGYMSDGSDGQDDYGGRISLRFEPASNFKLTLSGDYFHQGGTGPGSTPLALGIDNRYGLMSPQAQAYYTTKPVSIAGHNFVPITSNPFLDNEYWGMSATAEWKVPVGTITIIPAYREGHLNFRTTTPGFQISQKENDKQFSVEARVASDNDRPLRYLAGVFLYDETNAVPLYQVNSQFNASYQNYVANSKSMAVFGRLTYAFTEEFRATLGGRLTTEDKTFAGNLLGLNKLCLPIPTAKCPAATPFPYTTTIRPTVVRAGNSIIPQFDPVGGTLMVGNFIDSNRRASFDRITWRAGLDWDITPQNLLYASYETGFKSGGFFFSNDSGVYQPETISAWTVGSKNRFLDNRVQVNIEGFYWKYKNQQISHLGQDTLGTIIFPTENVGAATFKGVEIETQFLVTPNTRLSADVQYLDAKYNNFIYNVPNQGPPLSSCAIQGVPTTQITLNCSGFRPPNAPQWTINLGVQQTIPLGNDGKIVLNARTHHQTDTLTGLEFLPIEVQKGYWMSDASITYSAPGDRYFISAYVSNIEDKTVIGNTFPPPLGNFVVGSVRPPRTYGVRAGVKF
jgi:iron complex outermembrane receptor protein